MRETLMLSDLEIHKLAFEKAQDIIKELEAKLKESEDTGLKWYKRYTAAFEKYGVPEEVGEELIKTKAKVTELEKENRRLKRFEKLIGYYFEDFEPEIVKKATADE
jgi:hypothetical protein